MEFYRYFYDSIIWFGDDICVAINMAFVFSNRIFSQRFILCIDKIPFEKKKKNHLKNEWTQNSMTKMKTNRKWIFYCRQNEFHRVAFANQKSIYFIQCQYWLFGKCSWKQTTNTQNPIAIEMLSLLTTIYTISIFNLNTSSL